MPARQFLAIMVLFLAGTLSAASAKPPDLPVDITINCAAQEPEAPIDLLVEAWAPEVTVCDLKELLIDVVCPPLRLRHVPQVMACPYIKRCCDNMERALDECCDAMREYAARVGAEESEACPTPQADRPEPESCPYYGGNGRAASASKVAEAETEEAAETEDPVSPLPLYHDRPEVEVLDVMPVEDPEPISVMPKEEVVPDAEPPMPEASPEEPTTDPTPPTTDETPESVCPYLRQRACPPHADAASECPGTPLENLEKLEKAWHIYHKAEHCRAEGHLEQACRLYEEAKGACPGSRVADLAQHRLQQMYVLKAVHDPSPVVKEAEAWRLYHKAEHCRVAGEVERACRLYERAKKSCPGSKIEDLSSRRLVELYARKAMQDAPPSAEECEPPPCHPTNAGRGQLKAECMAIADELRGKAAQLLERGNYVEACVLADMAYHFTGECENVFGLLVKADELLDAGPTQTEKKTEPVEPGGKGGDETQPAEEPAETPDVPPTAPEAFVQPPFPPVDPAVVDALEKILREVGDPTIPKLIIQVDEPAAEEQEDPVSGWPYTPPPTDVPPSLLVDPTDDDAAEDPDAEAFDSPQDLARAAVAEHLEEMLRHAVATLEQGLSPEVELNWRVAPAGRVNLQIGNVNCSVICDGWGHRYILVGLTPAATGDLRAVQQDHIDRVVHWIEVMNSGGNSLPPDEPAADDDDSDDDDLLYYDDTSPV